jgi:hypothetical protein
MSFQPRMRVAAASRSILVGAITKLSDAIALAAARQTVRALVLPPMRIRAARALRLSQSGR